MLREFLRTLRSEVTGSAGTFGFRPLPEWRGMNESYEPDFSWLYAGVARSVGGCSIFCPCMDGTHNIEVIRSIHREGSYGA